MNILDIHEHVKREGEAVRAGCSTHDARCRAARNGVLVATTRYAARQDFRSQPVSPASRRRLFYLVHAPERLR
jgi:hypothetical protein